LCVLCVFVCFCVCVSVSVCVCDCECEYLCESVCVCVWRDSPEFARQTFRCICFVYLSIVTQELVCVLRA